MPDGATLTIQLDPQTAQLLADRAREEGVSPEQYAADVVSEIVAAGDVERWLREDIGAVYDAMKADPARAHTSAQVRAALDQEHERASGSE